MAAIISARDQSIDFISLDKEDEKCGICGLWFPDGTPSDAVNDHLMRHVNTKVEEFHNRQRDKFRV